MPKVIFALSNGRSGTYFSSQLFRLNTACAVVHEPMWQRGNPTFFGSSIASATQGDLASLRRLMEKKRDFIERLNKDCYVETSHAFLKSAYRVAHEYFSDLRFIRLIRDPLKVAKSLMQREALAQRWHMPMLFCRTSDGIRFQRWALTGQEPIFQSVPDLPLTRFQWFLLEWIEIEIRAQNYLDRYGEKYACVTLRCPEDLNNPDSLRSMFAQLGVRHREPLLWPKKRNSTWNTPTVIDASDRKAAATVIKALPAQYKTIFTARPYIAIPEVCRLFEQA